MQITHCPQCETAFKVSPQQLALAKGWVRCGRCSHVFEAHLHFETAPNPPSLPVPTTEAPELFRAAVTPAFEEVPVPVPSASAPVTSVSLSPPYAWWAAAAVLMLIGVWQLLWVQRNWLAAEEPALRPLLSALCGCEVTWPQEPDSVLIESSSFTENPEGGYTVQMRLRNTQHHPVAMPSLELSLMDLQDQVLVRRVFTPAELSAKDPMQALRDARVTLQFDLDETVSKRITGFRAFVFYP
jgi:predicted Zn finger-like uncharacterized protein